MSLNIAIILLLLFALIGANLPWLSDRIFFIKEAKGTKSPWMRLIEWMFVYFLIGFLAIGLERKVSGENHSQDWEFYAVTLCLFLVFALPGFIYRYELKRLLDRNRQL